MSDHSLIRNGWPHDDHGNPYLHDYGTGCAACVCGWVSLPFGNRRDRLAAYARHIGLDVP